jgi:hypothetical protein
MVGLARGPLTVTGNGLGGLRREQIPVAAISVNEYSATNIRTRISVYGYYCDGYIESLPNAACFSNFVSDLRGGTGRAIDRARLRRKFIQ